jgi:hypothetical protein
MGCLLTISRLYVPLFVRRRKLQELLAVTAEAFHSPIPAVEGLAFDDCLRQYAIFTRDEAEQAMQQGRAEEVKNRLYGAAFSLGRQTRKEFHIQSTEEVMQMARVVYKIIGIDFQGNSRGEIRISRCLFSDFYSCRTCQFMASLDQGILAGLSNGGRLEFSRRITEGSPCCQATLSGERISI